MKPDRQQQSAPLKERIRLDTILTAVGLFISFSLLVTTQLNGMEERIGARFDSRFDSLETNFNERMDSLETNFNARFDSLEGRVDALDSRITSLETSIRSSLEDLNSRVGYLEGRAGTGNDVSAAPPN